MQVVERVGEGDLTRQAEVLGDDELGRMVKEGRIVDIGVIFSGNYKIKEAQICLVLLPKSDYNTLALKIVKKLAKENNNFCYITLNKPLKTLLASLKKNKINNKKALERIFLSRAVCYLPPFVLSAKRPAGIEFPRGDFVGKI